MPVCLFSLVRIAIKKKNLLTDTQKQKRIQYIEHSLWPFTDKYFIHVFTTAIILKQRESNTVLHKK